ncbi:MAG: hypothetical protein K2N84_03520 [Clostridia bacterium]|nr:hypothetical protein [Clostridia bacterium]
MGKDYVKSLLLEKFTKVNPSIYAKKLKEKFSRDKSLWYKAITPKEVADKMYQEVNGDYSQLWEERCAVCFCDINKDVMTDCYISNDKLTWLCENCYHTLFGNQ